MTAMTANDIRIGVTVLLREIETRGVVRAIQSDVSGIGHKVSYWLNGKREEVWVCLDEIIKENA